jgi:hypothetical protein
MDRRRVLGSLGWGFLTLIALAFIFSGIGVVELIGDALLALCLVKAGLKVHGHIIGGPPKAGRPRLSRLRGMSSSQPDGPLAGRGEEAPPSQRGST